MRFKIIPLEERIVLDAALVDALDVKGPIDHVTPVDNTQLPGSLKQVMNVGDDLYFVMDDEGVETLWKTHGQSTQQIVLSNPPEGATIDLLVTFQNHLYFTYPYENQTWKTDGTSVNVTNINTESPPIVFDNYLFFKDTNGKFGRSDGTNFEEIVNTPADLYGIHGSVLNGQLFLFTEGVDTFHAKIIKVENAQGPLNSISFEEIKDIDEGEGLLTGISNSDIAVGQDQIFLSYTTSNGNHSGVQLWRSDGTINGTYLVKDFFSNIQGDTFINDMTIVGDKMIFSLETETLPSSSYEVWVSDGTLLGTHRLAPINKNVDGRFEIESYKNQVVIKKTVEDGSEIWLSDGTKDGSQIIINSSRIDTMHVISDYIYFENKSLLYRSNGTDGDKVLVKGVEDLTALTSVNETLFVFTSANRDGKIYSGSPNVSLSIPVAVDDIYHLNKGNKLSPNRLQGVLENDHDAEGQRLTVKLISEPKHAKDFKLNPDGSFSYAANGSFRNKDSFTYRIFDGTHFSKPATVTIRPAQSLGGIADRLSDLITHFTRQNLSRFRDWLEKFA